MKRTQAVVLGLEARLLADSRCGTTDVEGTHRQLRARLADGLCGDHADCLADSTSRPDAQVTSVTLTQTPRFDSQVGAGAGS